MKALFYPSYDQLSLTDLPIPEIEENEVLLRVKACGICSSEIETFKSKSPRRVPPLIMGHEFCGEIVAVGANVSTHKTGDNVVSNSVISCGECSTCKRGQTNLCANRQVFGMHRQGAFGEFVNVPAKSLIPMPATLRPEIACLAEPLANGIHMVNLTRQLNPEKVLILGAGPIGLLAQQAFRELTGADIIVADLKDDRLDVALKNGAIKAVNPSSTDLAAVVAEVTGGEGVDVAIDAVGTAQTNAQALQAVRPGGVVVLIGLYENARALQSYDIVLPEKHVTGTYAATSEEMAEAVRLLAKGQIDASSWIHYYSLDEGVKAFTDMMTARPEHIKSVILFP
jgi:2-desacetyl-2-hydroxyethyl bacteriochlorophyllide A dehydrogenase